MIYIVITLFIFNIILGATLYKTSRQLNSQKDKFRKEYLQKQSDILNKELQGIKTNIDIKRQELSNTEAIIDNQRRQVKELQETQAALIASEKEKITNELKNYHDNSLAKIKADLEEEDQKIRENSRVLFMENQKELQELYAEVVEWREKRDAINEEISRARAMSEQQDFYRICLPKETFEDIETFNTIRMRLNNRQALDKMLYDNYVSKPTKEMVKRVLKGRDPSGIYKVTNIQTKECYIGKSVNVATRWQNHIKGACGLEGIADSMFQRALKKYGIDQFTFELVEEVSKEKLTEREKYYIALFDTMKFGYNQRNG